MSWPQLDRKGVIGTLVFHAVIVIILMIFGFITPLPLPEEKGILVNFGDGDQGSGMFEPSKNTPAPAVKEVVQETTPQPEQSSEPISEPEPVAADQGTENLMTQDFEESVEVPAGVEEKSPEEIKKEEELRKQKELEEKLLLEKKRVEEAKRKEELRKQRELEEKLRREKELEEQRLRAEAEERKRKEEEAKRINEINSRVKNAFGSAGKETQKNESAGEGVTYKPGNQGSKDGSLNTKNRGEGGGFGDGISFSLNGRSPKGLPKPVYPGNEEGYVVVEVNVDRNGNVVKAIPGAKGSTTMNPQLLKAARDAALNAKFNADMEAPAIQVGKITYHFVLD